MEILGKEPGRDAYVVAVSSDGTECRALVPEELISDELRLASRPSHEQSYRWIAANEAQVREAIKAKLVGGYVKAPFDRIVLREP